MKTYEAPKLTVHGDVEKLTLGPCAGHFDALFGADGGLNIFQCGGGNGGSGS